MFLHNKFDYHQKLGGSSDLYSWGSNGESENTGHGRTEVAVDPYPTTTANSIIWYHAFIHWCLLSNYPSPLSYQRLESPLKFPELLIL